MLVNYYCTLRAPHCDKYRAHCAYCAQISCAHNYIANLRKKKKIAKKYMHTINANANVYTTRSRDKAKYYKCISNETAHDAHWYLLTTYTHFATAKLARMEYIIFIDINHCEFCFIHCLHCKVYKLVPRCWWAFTQLNQLFLWWMKCVCVVAADLTARLHIRAYVLSIISFVRYLPRNYK